MEKFLEASGWVSRFLFCVLVERSGLPWWVMSGQRSCWAERVRLTWWVAFSDIGRPPIETLDPRPPSHPTRDAIIRMNPVIAVSWATASELVSRPHITSCRVGLSSSVGRYQSILVVPARVSTFCALFLVMPNPLAIFRSVRPVFETVQCCPEWHRPCCELPTSGPRHRTKSRTTASLPDEPLKLD